MSLFKKKPVQESVVHYSPIEQNTTPAVIVPEKSAIEQQLEKILNNQAVIAGNQQTILDAIAGTQDLMRRLSQEAPEETIEEEAPEDEEVEPPKKVQHYRRKKKMRRHTTNEDGD